MFSNQFKSKQFVKFFVSQVHKVYKDESIQSLLSNKCKKVYEGKSLPRIASWELLVFYNEFMWLIRS